MKHSLMYISLHLIWFHEIQNEFRRELSVEFLKKLQGKKQKEKEVHGLSTGWKYICGADH